MRNNGKQQLQLAPVQIGQELDIHSIVIAFEQCGGNLSIFLKRLPNSSLESKQEFLYRLDKDLHEPVNAEYKQQWDEVLARGKHVRFLLVQEKALAFLENWQNSSDTSSTAEIAFAKFMLPEITARNDKEVQKNELDEKQTQEDTEADELIDYMSIRADAEDSQYIQAVGAVRSARS